MSNECCIQIRRQRSLIYRYSKPASFYNVNRGCNFVKPAYMRRNVNIDENTMRAHNFEFNVIKLRRGRLSTVFILNLYQFSL